MRATAYHVSFYAAVLIAAGAADTAAAMGVWRRRGSPGRNSLCVAMLAAALWSVAYALELAAPTTNDRELWGALKYVGVTALPAAWLVFALQYTGRVGRPSRWFLGALAIEPLVVLVLLVVSGTRHLVRFYPRGPAQPIPTVEVGVALLAACRLQQRTGLDGQRDPAGHRDACVTALLAPEHHPAGRDLCAVDRQRDDRLQRAALPAPRP